MSLVQHIERQAEQERAAAGMIDPQARGVTIMRSARELRRLGMCEAAIAAGVADINRARCSPPLTADELAEIVRTSMVLPLDVDTRALPFPVAASELMDRHAELRAALVNGLLRETEVANIIAPPKSRKSWLVADLALSIVTGTRWLGLECGKGPVLLIDNELHPETLAKRLRTVASARGLAPEDYAGLSTWCVRGHGLDINALLAPLEEHAASLRPKLIVLDALYRFVPKGTDENSNADATALYNTLDRIAGQTGAAMVVVHHASKGTQSDKAVTDMGAGAGAMARAADSHIVLRQHEEEDAAVLEAACRSWPPLPAMGIRWNQPRWSRDDGLDVAAVKGRKVAKADAGRISPQDFASRCVGPEPVGKATIITAAEAIGITASRAAHLLKAAQQFGSVHAHAKAGTGQVATFATVAPDPAGTVPKLERVRDYLAAHPEASTDDVCTATGASPTYVRGVRRESRLLSEGIVA